MNLAIRTIAAAAFATGLLGATAARADLGPWDVFNNIDPGAAFVGGTPVPVMFTLGVATYITDIFTYHLDITNTTDVIGLTPDGGATMYFDATSPGLIGGYANLMDAGINLMLDAGTYTVTDALDASWAYNAASGFAGMTEVTAPEPASMAILGVSLAGLGFYRRRR